MGAQKNPLIETFFVEYQQHMSYLRYKKNYFQLPTLIWGPALYKLIQDVRGSD